MKQNTLWSLLSQNWLGEFSSNLVWRLPYLEVISAAMNHTKLQSYKGVKIFLPVNILKVWCTGFWALPCTLIFLWEVQRIWVAIQTLSLAACPVVTGLTMKHYYWFDCVHHEVVLSWVVTVFTTKAAVHTKMCSHTQSRVDWLSRFAMKQYSLHIHCMCSPQY